jgi:hypothetical protein
MQISDMLGRAVVDRDGLDVGVVSDVRLVQDGPFIQGFGSALRVDALVVGQGGVGARLGFIRGGVKGPWPLRTLAGMLEGRARLVPWDRMTYTDGTFRTVERRDDLPRLRHVYQAGDR